MIPSVVLLNADTNADVFCLCRHHFTSASMLKLLSTLVPIQYNHDNAESEVGLIAPVLYQMVFSHSKFMEVMLSRDQKLQTKGQHKRECIDIAFIGMVNVQNNSQVQFHYFLNIVLCSMFS